MEYCNTLGQRIRLLNLSIRQNIDRKLTDLGLTGVQSFILHYLDEQNGCAVYARDIEKRFSLSHATVSGILQRLESKEFIVLEEDAADRRRHRILLTDKAKCCGMKIKSYIGSLDQTMTLGMNEAEIAELSRLLEKAASNLSSEEERLNA